MKKLLALAHPASKTEIEKFDENLNELTVKLLVKKSM